MNSILLLFSSSTRHFCKPKATVFIIDIIIIVFIIIWKFYTAVLTCDFSLTSEWQQISSSLNVAHLF